MRALLVEDDKLHLSWLESVMRKQGYDTEAAAHYEQAEQLIDVHEFDEVVLDIRLPQSRHKQYSTHSEPIGRGIKLAWKIKLKNPDTGVIFHSVFDGYLNEVKALIRHPFGGIAYIYKAGTETELLQALYSVQRNSIYIDSEFISYPLSFEGRKFLDTLPDEYNFWIQSAFKQYSTLTPRELEIVPMLALGVTKDALAAQLCVSISTVESHVSHIYSKLFNDLPSDFIFQKSILITHVHHLHRVENPSYDAW